MEDSEPQYVRIGGLLISEWVTWIMIVVVIAAVGFGFVVGGERDAQADAAVASLDAVAARWAEADARGEMLTCSDEAADAGLLSNEYLELELRPIAQGSVFVFPLVYGALLAVQKLLPKAFAPAYAAGAALVFGPLLFQLIAG